MGTDEKSKQGTAWASQSGAAFSNPSSSELARNCENLAPTRSASTLLLLSTLDSGRSTPEDTGLQLACQAERCLESIRMSSLAGDFPKQLRHSCNESTLDFSGQQTCSSSFDLRLPYGAAPFGPTFGCSSLRPPVRSVVIFREIRG